MSILNQIISSIIRYKQRKVVQVVIMEVSYTKEFKVTTYGFEPVKEVRSVKKLDKGVYRVRGIDTIDRECDFPLSNTLDTPKYLRTDSQNTSVCIYSVSKNNPITCEELHAVMCNHLRDGMERCKRETLDTGNVDGSLMVLNSLIMNFRDYMLDTQVPKISS